MRRIIALIVILPLLQACATSRTSPWVASFESLGASSATTQAVRIEAAPYDMLDSNPEIDGFRILGVSRFRGEQVEDDPFDPDGPLARHARRIGADLVRIAFRPAGTETRTEYVRTHRPATGAPGGNIASGRGPEMETEPVPVEIEVPVFDHIAIFYRAVG